MADVQIAILDQQNTQVTAAVPGVQGPAGEGVPQGGTANQVLFKQSGTDYDTTWGEVTSAMIGDLEIVDADVAANAEIAVSKLADGSARQLLQTDAAGTGVEWTSNVDVPGTLDVTSTATFDSIASHPLGSAGAPTITFTGDTNTGIYSPGADQVAISTNGTGRLFVDASGEVGIGTANPNRFLTINDASQPDLALSVGDTEKLRLQSTSSENYVDLVGQDLVLRGGPTGISERLRVTTGGLVGIGTSSPQTTVQAVGAIESRSANAYRGIRIEAQAGGFQVLKAHNYLGVGYNSQLQFQTMDGTSVTTAMTIDAAGRVGIGTTSPGDRLELQGGDFRIAANSLQYHKIAYASNNFVFTANAGAANQSSSFVFSSSASGSAVTERARIDSSGRLLVGTSSARSRFFNNPLVSSLFSVEVSTDNQIEFAGIRNRNDINGAIIALAKSRGTTAGSNTIVQSGDEFGRVSFQGSDGTELVEAALIQAQVDGTPGANDMPGRLVFSTTADGARFPTEQLRITSDRYVRLASGTGGIQFNGDTAAANALDDYEEGTWTVTFHDAVSGGNQSATTATGTYTKIGRSVHLQFNVNNINTTGLTGSNQLFFSLPLTGLSSPFAEYNGACAVRGTSLATTPMATHLVSNSARAYFLVNSTGASFGSLTISSITSGANGFRASLSYMA